MASTTEAASIIEPSETNTRKEGLYLSLVVIIGYWVFVLWPFFLALALRPKIAVDSTMSGSVRDVSLSTGIRASVTLVIVWLLLRVSRERLPDLGLRWSDFQSAIFRSFLMAIGLFLVSNVLLGTVLSAVIGSGETGANAGVAPVVKDLFRNSSEAPYWILASVAAGFGEELQRAFTLTRFDRLFGKVGLTLALLVDSCVFGLGHLYQGPSGVITAMFDAAILALIFLRSRRASDAIITHAGVDLLGAAAVWALYGR